MKVIVTGFLNTMTPHQRTAGWIYLPLHILLIPLAVTLLGYFMPDLGIDNVLANSIYYAFGLVYCLVFFWTYLRGGFDILLDNLGKNIVLVIGAYCIYFLLGMIASAALMFLEDGSVLNPNNEAVMKLAGDNPKAALGLAVFAAPLVEEILFRGTVFGAIRPKSRTWAYIVSIVLFSLYHVWQYAVVYMDASYLVYAISYIPAAYALAWIYEHTNCIWMSIFLHMIINATALAIGG